MERLLWFVTMAESERLMVDKDEKANFWWLTLLHLLGFIVGALAGVTILMRTFRL